MKKSQATNSGLWSVQALDIGQAGAIRIGPLYLAIERREHEWRLHYSRTTRPEEFVDEAFTLISGKVPAFMTSERFAFKKTTSLLELTPALADRPVVTRPVVPITLPGGEEATLYVSSPLWLQISLNASGNRVREIPIQLASDTWFGPSTREGELCYASHTRAFLNPDELPQQSHRAITPINIVNSATTPLNLERISLPTLYLSLFSSENGTFWTESVTLARESDGDMASLKVNRGKPVPGMSVKQVSPPRQEMHKGILVRAFSGLLGE